MKIYIIILFGIMNYFAYSKSILYPDFKRLLITDNNKPTPALLALLATCKIPHNGSLKSIITATQKEQPIGFLRPSDKERWQISSYLTEKRDAIIAQCAELEMFSEIQPKRQVYDYAIIFGGTIEKVKERIAFLMQLWNKGIRWDNLIILTGQRILDPIIESAATWHNNNSSLLIKPSWQLKNPPITETDMVRMILEQSVLPEAWESIAITIIDTPQQIKRSGLTRPNTIDTIYHWLSTNPLPGSIIAISMQPSIGYQDAVLKKIMPPSFYIETVGPTVASDTIEPEILIGTVGWWLFNTINN